MIVSLCIFTIGVYLLGYHYGIEKMRVSDSGLGGFAEWAGSLILIVMGLIVGIICLILRNKKRASYINE